MGAITRWPQRADRRGLRRRLRARLHHAGHRRRPDADAWRRWLRRHGLIADCVVPELHQSEQPVDRHRRAAVGARHLRQLSSSTPTAGAEVMMNDPKYLRAPHHPRRARRRRRAGRGGHGQGQAARAARPPDCAGICFSSEKADQATRGRQRHRRRAAAGRHARARRSTAPSCRSSCSPPA